MLMIVCILMMPQNLFLALSLAIASACTYVVVVMLHWWQSTPVNITH
jgi:hypothetical protein